MLFKKSPQMLKTINIFHDFPYMSNPPEGTHMDLVTSGRGDRQILVFRYFWANQSNPALFVSRADDAQQRFAVEIPIFGEKKQFILWKNGGLIGNISDLEELKQRPQMIAILQDFLFRLTEKKYIEYG